MADALTHTGALLLQLLDDPEAVSELTGLSPGEFGELIELVGLEQSGELMALASPAQLEALLDDELWGAEDSFDPDAFGLWLDVMLEAGELRCAERLASLPAELVQLGFATQLFVLDADTLGMGLARASQHEAELVERALDASLYMEFGSYTLVCRRPLSWDATVSALLAWDREDPAAVVSVLEHCASASTQYMESREGLEGLQRLLSEAESMAEAADGNREARRARRGHVAHADAKAFLALVGLDFGEAGERDAITSAYFRELSGPEGILSASEATAPNRLRQLLDQRRSRLHAEARALGRSTSLPSPELRAFRRALAACAPEAQVQRRAELVYLANVLVSAREADPDTAPGLVLQACAQGLARHQGAHGQGTIKPQLEYLRCDQLFRLARAPN